MITYVVGDLFLSPAQTLVNTVNTVGAMGKGLAYQFKRYYPDMFTRYAELCARNAFDVGQLWLYKTPHKWILNFPTKAHWRDPSRLEYVEAGLRKFVATYADQGMTTVSFPLLGAGLGGLDWEGQVRPLMERYLDPLPIDIFIHLYEPDNPFMSQEITPHDWLAGIPQTPPFALFRDELAALVKNRHEFEILDDHTSFQVAYDEAIRRITMHVPSGGEIILSESVLSDLWHHIHTNGYCLPQNLPGGLDSHAALIVGLLAQLPTIRPIFIWRPGQQRQIGLHFMSPVMADKPVLKVL